MVAGVAFWALGHVVECVGHLPHSIHLYSTLVWWLMCKYFQSLHTRSGLRSGLPFPRLVWSWRWQISWDQVWCTVRTRLVCILIYFCPAWSGVVVPANTDIWFYLQQLYTYLGQWFIMVLNSAWACSDVLWFMVSQLLSLCTWWMSGCNCRPGPCLMDKQLGHQSRKQSLPRNVSNGNCYHTHSPVHPGSLVDASPSRHQRGI